jgi:hypothetical protein
VSIIVKDATFVGESYLVIILSEGRVNVECRQSVFKRKVRGTSEAIQESNSDP